MVTSSISNNKLHCILFVLFLILVICITWPLTLIKLANDRGNQSDFDHHLEPVVPPDQDFTQFNCTKYALDKNFTTIQSNGKCPERFFNCVKACNDICIPQDRNCNSNRPATNKEFDCPDGSDEDLQDCFDSYGYNEGTYKHMALGLRNKAKQYSKQERCQKSHLDLNRCPCNTTEEQVVFCTYDGRRSIPSDLKQSVFKLHMMRNRIRSLSNVSWPRELNILILQENYLEQLDNDTFATAPKLKSVFLANNYISDIEVDAFRGTSITKLSLHHNLIRELKPGMFLHLKEVHELDLSFNLIESVSHVEFSILENLSDLVLANNLIKAIDANTYSNMKKLERLTLSNNQIETIDDKAFSNDPKLIEIRLGGNMLRHLKENTFYGLIRLKRLDLSNNPELSTLDGKVFSHLKGLKSLDLRDLEFDNPNNTWFAHIDLRFIYFSHYIYCSFATMVPVCEPHVDVVGRKDEMIIKELAPCLWVMAFVCTFANMYIFFRPISNKERSNVSLIIRNLSVADFMMGLYLASISWRNQQFGSSYTNESIFWIRSEWCAFLGFLAIFSGQSSLLIIFILTIERYRLFALKNNSLDKEELINRARRMLSIAWLVALLIALIPLLGLAKKRRIRYHGNGNGLCLPLYIDNPFHKGWQYSAVFYSFNFINVIIILTLNLQMYIEVMNTRKSSCPAMKRSYKRLEGLSLTLRFLFFTLVECLCWIPIVVIKFLAILNIKISHDINCWIVVIVLPVNSVLNPIIYTLGRPSIPRKIVNKIVGIVQNIDKFLCTSGQETDATDERKKILTYTGCVAFSNDYDHDSNHKLPMNATNSSSLASSTSSIICDNEEHPRSRVMDQPLEYPFHVDGDKIEEFLYIDEEEPSIERDLNDNILTKTTIVTEFTRRSSKGVGLNIARNAHYLTRTLQANSLIDNNYDVDMVGDHEKRCDILCTFDKTNCQINQALIRPDDLEQHSRLLSPSKRLDLNLSGASDNKAIIPQSWLIEEFVNHKSLEKRWSPSKNHMDSYVHVMDRDNRYCNHRELDDADKIQVDSEYEYENND